MEPDETQDSNSKLADVQTETTTDVVKKIKLRLQQM